MAELGVWTRAQVEDAKIEAVVSRSLHAPLSAALLARRLRNVHPASARIHSTLDPGLQRTLEERVTSYFSDLPPRTSAALLVVDNATMEARAYVGSVAFGDKARHGDVDMVQAWRSPGSTLKPFLYGMALDDGLIHSESLLVDAPQSFDGYRPGNFGGAFNGPVGAAQALRLSLNIPAVDLLDRVGPARFSARLDNAGISLKFPRGAQPTLSLLLGGPGARPADLVGAFASPNRHGTAGQVRWCVQRPGRRGAGAAAVAEHSRRRPARARRPGALFGAAGQRRHLAEVPARCETEPVADPWRHGCAARGPGGRLCIAQPRRHRRARPLHARRRAHRPARHVARPRVARAHDG